jgi:hypothetical protein
MKKNDFTQHLQMALPQEPGLTTENFLLGFGASAVAGAYREGPSPFALASSSISAESVPTRASLMAM